MGVLIKGGTLVTSERTLEEIFILKGKQSRRLVKTLTFRQTQRL